MQFDLIPLRSPGADTHLPPFKGGLEGDPGARKRWDLQAVITKADEMPNVSPRYNSSKAQAGGAAASESSLYPPRVPDSQIPITLPVEWTACADILQHQTTLTKHISPPSAPKSGQQPHRA